MGLFSNLKTFKDKVDCAFPSAQHTAPLTTPPAGFPKPVSWSSRASKVSSLADTLRHHFRRYWKSFKHKHDGSTCEAPMHPSDPPSRLALKFEENTVDGGSLADLLQNFQLTDDVSTSSTRNCIPMSSISGTNTSTRTGATSVGSFHSSKLGLTATSLEPFNEFFMLEDSTFNPDHQDSPIPQEVLSSCANATEKLVAYTLPGDENDDNNTHPFTSEPVESEIRSRVTMQDPGGRGASTLATKEECSSTLPSTSDADTTTPHIAGSGESSKAALERHDWDMFEKIPDESFKQMLQTTINQKDTRNVALHDCTIVQRFRGGFNHIVYMLVLVDKRFKHYVVRVPSIGTKARWREGDAHNLRCEVALTKYLYQETGVPVPKIIAFDDTIDSAIGAPFTLMKRLRGRPAQTIWYDDPANRNYETTSQVTPETEVKRYNFLRSLAYIMAKLEDLQFDQIGMPDFTRTLATGDDPKVTCSYRWKSPKETTPEDLESDSQIYKYGPFKSSKDYMIADLDEAWPSTPDPDLDDYPDTQNMILGVRKILDIIYSQPAISSSTASPLNTKEPESFVLRHPDLDFQNILCDDDGNVSAIIDWEGCLAVPRCAGFACVPDFLCRDWSEDHELSEMPHMDWQIDRYIQIYADAMREAGVADAACTRKSAMYRAIVGAVNGGSPMDLIQKLFAGIPGMQRVDVEKFEQLIGKGCPATEAFLKAEIGKLLAPEELVSR